MLRKWATGWMGLAGRGGVRRCAAVLRLGVAFGFAACCVAQLCVPRTKPPGPLAKLAATPQGSKTWAAHHLRLRTSGGEAG